MKNKVYVKPSKPALIVGLIAMIIMLAFGIFFLFLLSDEGSNIGVGFVSVWLLFVLLIAGVFIYNLINKKEEKNIGGEITFIQPPTQKEADDDFDTKLRKLELLRKDGIINDQEYQEKREEIINSKW